MCHVVGISLVCIYTMFIYEIIQQQERKKKKKVQQRRRELERKHEAHPNYGGGHGDPMAKKPRAPVDPLAVALPSASKVLGNVAEIQNFPTCHQDLSMEKPATRGRRVHLHTLADR